jgi:hypothetical protein
LPLRVSWLSCRSKCVKIRSGKNRVTALPGTVSLISQIGEDGEKRTYQIIRAGSDGKAYASSMVKKYALTYEAIQERIGSSR